MRQPCGAYRTPMVIPTVGNFATEGDRYENNYGQQLRCHSTAQQLRLVVQERGRQHAVLLLAQRGEEPHLGKDGHERRAELGNQ